MRAYSGRRLHQRPQFVELLFLDPPVRHAQHDKQGQPAAQFHLFLSPDKVLFKSKGLIQAAVDTLNTGAFFINRLPLITAAGQRRKNAGIGLYRNADTVTDAAAVPTFAVQAVMFGRTAIFQGTAILFKAPVRHWPFLPFDRTVAKNRSPVIITDIHLPVYQSRPVGFPLVPYIDHRLDAMIIPQRRDQQGIIIAPVAKPVIGVFKNLRPVLIQFSKHVTAHGNVGGGRPGDRVINGHVIVGIDNQMQLKAKPAFDRFPQAAVLACAFIGLDPGVRIRFPTPVGDGL